MIVEPVRDAPRRMWDVHVSISDAELAEIAPAVLDLLHKAQRAGRLYQLSPVEAILVLEGAVTLGRVRLRSVEARADRRSGAFYWPGNPMKTIDRWLVNCRACRQRFMQDGESPPAEHECPVFGPGVKRRPSEVKRIVWRAPRGGREHCRMSEPRAIVVEPHRRSGHCSLQCRGSLSPTCYCLDCGGAQHGIENLFTIHEPDGGSDIMDRLVAQNSSHDVPRRARKTT